MEKSVTSNVKPYNQSGYPRKSHINLHSREWKCHICCKNFDSESSLRAHENTHVTPFCKKCNKMFKSAKQLCLHDQNTHNNETSKEFSSSDDELNICEDLSLNKVVKEEPIELVSEPEIENLLNHDPHSSSLTNETSPHNFRNTQDFYPESSKALGIWRNFETPSSAFLEHSSVPLSIKMEPSDVPAETDQFDFIINEILKKPTNENTGTSLVAEEIPMQQNFWTQSEHQSQQEQQEIWTCDICNRSFSTKQILQRHRIALHDHNKDFKCDQCNLWFSSSNNHELIKHVNEVHNGFKKFVCDFNGCNKEFSRRDALKRHRSTHEAHKKSVIQQSASKHSSGIGASQSLPTYSCFDCGINFRYHTSLLLHLKNHKI